MEEKKEVVVAPVDVPAVAKPAPAKPITKAPAAPVAKPVPPPAFGFARPLDLGKQMLRSLAAGDFEGAGKLAAAGDPAQVEMATKVFENLLKNLGAKPGSEDQVELLGMVENKTRVSIPLTLPGQTGPIRMQLDLERDERMGWKISRLQLPKEVAAALPPPPAVPAPAGPGNPPMVASKSQAGSPKATSPAGTDPAKAPNAALFDVQESPDALTFGSDFVQALLRHDFVTARKFVDETKVPAERLAGLCIVFEEGKYEFKPNKPLIITVANPEVSWVIAQVQSEALQQSTEFGMELQRAGADQPWKVVGLNLSEILNSFAASASKMGVAYTPIVNNPTGGESLALYFEYDQAQLHPRAKKQLEIVAGLLKSNASRKLQIAGHTDAKGTDNYNIQLSQSRAESVKQQLVALGVSQDQIVTTGLGKAQPLGPNQKADGTDDPQGRSKNRRAEIYLDF
jgi:outer membrane protein OmpA-like peptidoglycan-associated protein